MELSSIYVWSAYCTHSTIQGNMTFNRGNHAHMGQQCQLIGDGVASWRSWLKLTQVHRSMAQILYDLCLAWECSVHLARKMVGNSVSRSPTGSPIHKLVRS